MEEKYIFRVYFEIAASKFFDETNFQMKVYCMNNYGQLDTQLDHHGRAYCVPPKSKKNNEIGVEITDDVFPELKSVEGYKPGILTARVDLPIIGGYDVEVNRGFCLTSIYFCIESHKILHAGTKLNSYKEDIVVRFFTTDAYQEKAEKINLGKEYVLNCFDSDVCTIAGLYRGPYENKWRIQEVMKAKDHVFVIEKTIPVEALFKDLGKEVKAKHLENAKKELVEHQMSVNPISIRKLSVCCRNLRRADALSDSDPFFKWTIPGRKNSVLQSKVIQNTLNPEWEIREIVLDDEVKMDTKITCFVYDKDVLDKDDLLGKCTFTISDLWMEKITEFELFDKKDKKVVVSEEHSLFIVQSLKINSKKYDYLKELITFYENYCLN